MTDTIKYMSDIAKINLLRNAYNALNGSSDSEIVRELKRLKSEVQVSNALKATEDTPINSATNSPYLEDQPFYNKETLYNSKQETDWKEVRSYEEQKREALVFRNLKRLNIL